MAATKNSPRAQRSNTDATINLYEEEDEDVLARVTPTANRKDSADARGAGRDGTRQFDNQLARNITHTITDLSGQRARGE